LAKGKKAFPRDGGNNVRTAKGKKGNEGNYYP